MIHPDSFFIGFSVMGLFAALESRDYVALAGFAFVAVWCAWDAR